MNNTIRIYQGDALEVLRTLQSDSVHCLVTSPPYWGLRDYGVDGQIGLEQTFEEWLTLMVELFAEVKRVLHPTGTIWVNMGDSYNSSLSRGAYGDQAAKGYTDHGRDRPVIKRLHSKNLVGQPWKLAFALQDDGWIMRKDIIWSKPNAMPESIQDRPTSAHEYIHLFSKKPRYYYDAWAIKEKSVEPAGGNRGGSFVNQTAHKLAARHGETDPYIAAQNHRGPEWNSDGLKNKRSVWEIATEACPDAHFATYPKKLVEPCILAGTSEKGCCPTCLTPWVRTFETVGISKHGGKRKRADAPGAEVSPSSVFNTGEINVKRPTGWKQDCNCDPAEPIPCTVLDPFTGSGTTAIVAARLQRHFVGSELNPDYIEIARKRIHEDQPLFNRVEVVA